MKADQIAAFCAAAGNVKAGAAEWVKAQGKMDPDVFVLYRGDDNKYMLTRFGAKEHHKADGHSYSKTDLFLYKCRKNFLYAYSERYVEYGINPDDYDGVVLFENKGMYAVSEEQARVLMEKNDDKAFFDTLEAVVKSEDMTALKLTPEAQKERNSFVGSAASIKTAATPSSAARARNVSVAS